MSKQIKLKIMGQFLDQLKQSEEKCKVEQDKPELQRRTNMTDLNTLIQERDKITAQIQSLEEESKTGTDKILEAIKKQRWYFFRNKPKVLLDRNSGLLWANLNYFPYNKGGALHHADEISETINNYDFDSFAGFRVPTCYELWNMIEDKTFPFAEGNNWRIKDCYNWFVYYNNEIKREDLDNSGATNSISTPLYRDCLLPCSDYLVAISDYANNVSSDNKVYSEKERSQFTLDLFVQNELLPIFEEDEITQLYKKIYFDKPALLKQAQELQTQIEPLQAELEAEQARLAAQQAELEAEAQKKSASLSAQFNYLDWLAKYDLPALDSSPIKYYQGLQQWTTELLDKLDSYQEAKADIIQDFSRLNLRLAEKYEPDPNLNPAENELLAARQDFFRQNFSLDLHSSQSQILLVKRQANQLEASLDQIDRSENYLQDLARLEKEDRPSFALVAENTAKVVRKALLKMEYFESNQPFVRKAVALWEQWSEDYRIFKTTYQEDLKNACQDDGVEAEIWQKWYADWQNLRYEIEKKVQPLLEWGLQETRASNSEQEGSLIERLAAVLAAYKDNIDQFFIKERRGIYQKFAFQAGGDLQEKFETESELYKCTLQFQTDLQEIIFSCPKSEERIFILDWANSLLNIQIEEILSFVADQDLQQISQVLLEEFAQLKQKNLAIYLADAKAYSEEQAEREKEYNSLIFKMRKDLANNS